MATSTMVSMTGETGAQTEQEQRRLHLLKEMMCGHSAWSREARALLALAQERGVALDDDTLVYSDVRDLQAMQTRLGTAPRLGTHAA